jgi:hypothetical protein
MTNPTPPTPQGAAHSPADASEDYSSADCSPGASTRWGLPQFDFGLRLRPARRVRRALLGSVLISSVAFMLVHLYQTPDLTTLVVLGSSTLVLGLANAVLATSTGRLGPGIVGPMVLNGDAVLGFLATA